MTYPPFFLQCVIHVKLLKNIISQDPNMKQQITTGKCIIPLLLSVFFKC